MNVYLLVYSLRNARVKVVRKILFLHQLQV